MTVIISLDSGPLSLITFPKPAADADACKQWLAGKLSGGARVVVPEIVDYELRRELLRAGRSNSIARLDAFLAADPARLIRIDSLALRRAAELWSDARRRGLPTADVKELDIDVVQVAQLASAGFDPADLVIATTNVGHLSRFVRAETWDKI
jgi:predicted nucleic acid-binding protein